MSVTSPRARRARLLILLMTGTTALSIAACSTSDNQNATRPSTSVSQPSSAPKPPPPPSPMGKDHIEGLVRSVSGNAIQLTQRDRSAATVDFTPQTIVTELSSAALTDVKPGICVDVRSAPQSASPGGAITAESIEISPAIADRCPPPPGPAQRFTARWTPSRATPSTSTPLIPLAKQRIAPLASSTRPPTPSTPLLMPKQSRMVSAWRRRVPRTAVSCALRRSTSNRAHRWAAATTISTSHGGCIITIRAKNAARSTAFARPSWIHS